MDEKRKRKKKKKNESETTATDHTQIPTQNVPLRRLIVGCMVANFVLRRRISNHHFKARRQPMKHLYLYIYIQSVTFRVCI